MELLLKELEKNDIKLFERNGELIIDYPQKVKLPKHLLEEIKKNKESLVIYLLNKNNKIHAAQSKEYYVASSAQKRLYFLYEFDKESLNYNMPELYKLDGEIEINRIEDAVKMVIDKHESLRTTFKVIRGEPVQIIHDCSEFKVKQINISKSINEYFVDAFITPFNLNTGPLFRIELVNANNEWYLLMDMHHIITDGSSQKIFIEDFISAYSNKRIDDLPLQYKDFAEWQYENSKTESHNQQKNYWLNRFAGEIPCLNLPIDYPRHSAISNTGSKFSMCIDSTHNQVIKSITRKNKTTTFSFLLASFNILFAKLCCQNDIVIGAPVFRRPDPRLNNVIGLFLNTICFKNTVSFDKTFQDFLQEVNKNVLDSLDNQDFQYEELIDSLKISREVSRNPLFDIFLNYQNYQKNRQNEIGNLKIQNIPQEKYFSKFDITININDLEPQNEILIECIYKKDLFDNQTIEYIFLEFCRLIDRIIDSPEERLEKYEIFCCKDIVVAGNSINPSIEYTYFERSEIEQSIPLRFDNIIRRFPNKTALKSNNQAFTYKQLDDRCNMVALYILKTVKDSEETSVQGSNIILLFGHNISMIIAILSSLKSGKTYVPVDPDFPINRIVSILNDSNSRIIITESRYVELATQISNLADNGVIVIDIEAIGNYFVVNDLLIQKSFPDKNDICYVLYTSGSTGNPKGVCQTHRNVLHFIQVYTNALKINCDDNLSMLSNYHFDASVMSIYGGLLNGATICLYDIKNKGIDGLSDYIISNNISIYHSTPSIYRSLLNAQNKDIIYESVRLVVLGGESTKKNDFDLFKKYFNDDCIMINGLGPTESTVTLQYFMNKSTRIKSEIIPVGYPVENTKVFIIKNENEIARVYEQGEIVYQSDYLALGYLNDEEKTKKVFPDNLLGDGKRCYKSGDIGRILSNGMIEFTGRNDSQFKIRGIRVEIGDIESKLKQIPYIIDAVVLPQTINETTVLIAYIVSNLSENKTFDIKNRLRKELPDYMIPNHFIRIDELPLNQNGKIDKNKLMTFYTNSLHNVDLYRPLESKTEQELGLMWQNLLNVEKIGAEDNFFDVGGHSLMLFKLKKQILERFGIDIPMNKYFDHSLSQISRLIDSHSNK
jgi:amino acid adenylation domain-containing protein